MRPMPLLAVSRTAFLFLILCLCFFKHDGFGQEPESNEPSTWRAGVGKVCITPEDSMWMSGYGSRDQPAQGKLTDLWAKILVLESASGQRAVLLTLDLIGIDRGMSKSICDRLHERYQLSRNEILICTSHTHTGPAVGANLQSMLDWRLSDPQRQQIGDYTESLVIKISDEVGNTLQSLQPVFISTGNGQCDFAVNSRNNTEDQVKSLRTNGSLIGPIDPAVPVLALRNRAGDLVCVVFGYACHATVLSSYEWSGDYPGYAQMELETRYPGCVAMFWAGCGADQNPLPRRTPQLAAHYGRRLADSVETVLLTMEMNSVDPTLAVEYAEISLRFSKIPTREEIERDLMSPDPYTVSRAKLLVKQLENGQAIPETYPYPIATWKLGDDLGHQIRWIALGGEVVVDYALQLKSLFPSQHTWVTAYANDVMAYIPSRRVLLEGGYEGGGAMLYYGLPSAWDESVEQSIVDEVRRQLR